MATASLLPHGPLIPASDHWGNWTVLLAIAALGIWSEKKTQAGKALSGALVSVLVGLAASSAGIVSADASAYRVVLDYLLPLAIPMLLFTADLRRVLRFTGILLFAFLLGSPVNYIAFSEALGVSPSVLAAGLATDNVICAVCFTTLFALATKIPAENSELKGDGEGSSESLAGDKLLVLQSVTSWATGLNELNTTNPTEQRSNNLISGIGSSPPKRLVQWVETSSHL